MKVRTHYIYEINEVQRALLQLDEAVQHSISRVVRALLTNDKDAARYATHDDEIDERRVDIEARVLHLITSQQPIASDLRFLLAALRIADELERIGDYAEGIANLVARDVHEPPLSPPYELKDLSKQVQSMLHTSVAAFVARDAGAAAQLHRADDCVDLLTTKVQAQMQTYLQANPVSATRAVHYLFVAHNLERIADRAVNIAERTAFIITGKLPQQTPGNKDRQLH
jgi:phosphate transport system protein